MRDRVSVAPPLFWVSYPRIPVGTQVVQVLVPVPARVNQSQVPVTHTTRPTPYPQVLPRWVPGQTSPVSYPSITSLAHHIRCLTLLVRLLRLDLSLNLSIGLLADPNFICSFQLKSV